MPGRAVDTRGAGELAEDPVGYAERLAAQAGLSIEHILTAREDTRTELEALRAELAATELPADTSVCLFGSWGRGELTDRSDYDWALLTREPVAEEDEEVAEAVERLRERFGEDDRAPGSTDTFGVAFDVRKLVEEIGLDEDDNKNITRRQLLLLESVGVTGTLRDEGFHAVLDRYLERGIKDYHVPRFMLNDLVRYWRTICVDFEGKHKDSAGEDPKWVTRNAKLRVSRKLLFASGLLPILLCEQQGTDQMREHLPRWLNALALDRVAASFALVDASSEGVRALEAYDRWLAILQSAEKRAELLTLTEQTRASSPLYLEIKSIGNQLEAALLALLFDTNVARLAREYVVF
jgi:predicted nucleotidyltransferase